MAVVHHPTLAPSWLSRRVQIEGSAQIWTLKSARAMGKSLQVSIVRKKIFSGENAVFVFQAIKRRPWRSRTELDMDAYWRYQFWNGDPFPDQRASMSWKVFSTIVITSMLEISWSWRWELLMDGTAFIVQVERRVVVCCLLPSPPHQPLEFGERFTASMSLYPVTSYVD